MGQVTNMDQPQKGPKSGEAPEEQPYVLMKKPPGRAEGSFNMRATRWKAMKEHIEGDATDKAITELEQLEGEKYLFHYEKLLQYFKPRLQAVAVATVPQDQPLQIVVSSQEALEAVQAVINSSREEDKAEEEGPIQDAEEA